MMKTDCVHCSVTVQVEAIRDAKKFHPEAAFWIKADACDVLPGIQESVNHKWAGDVDLNDGAVLSASEVYHSVLDKVSTFGLGKRRERCLVADDVSFLKAKIQSYISSLEKIKVHR